MLIRSAVLSLSCEDLERADARVLDLAKAYGGFVGSRSLDGSRKIERRTWELRIDSSRFEACLADLRALGRVLDLSTEAKDVTAEFVDVESRIANGREIEARIVRLIADDAGTIEDVLEIENALGRVRREIEELEGRKRFLATHVRLSTIRVHARESGTGGPPPSLAGIAETWSASIGALGAVLWGGLLAVIGAAPWLPIPIVFWLAWRRLRRANEPVTT